MPNACCLTVEQNIFKLIHTILYLQILDIQLISITHERGNFPKVLALWFGKTSLDYRAIALWKLSVSSVEVVWM